MSRFKNKRKSKKTPEEYGAAVYYQRTKVFQEEFKLIGIVTEREEQIKQLEGIIREVKEGRKDCDDEVILQTFRLFNQVRASTIKVITAISIWQQSFTRNIRPIIFGNDFIEEKLIKYINFVNASKIRKIFNFQFFRGNMLLLPFPNLKNEAPIRVSPALGKEIQEFARPNEQEIITAYNIIYNCLPEDIFKEKLISLQKWLVEPWTPRVWISNAANIEQRKLFHPSGKPKSLEELQAEDELHGLGRKRSMRLLSSTSGSKARLSLLQKTPPSSSEGRRERMSGISLTPSRSRPSSPTALQISTPTNRSPPPLLRRQSSLKKASLATPSSPAPLLRSSTSQTNININADEESPAVKLKRRNQLVPKQAEVLKSFTKIEIGDNSEDPVDLLSRTNSFEDPEEILRQQEMQALEDYYNSLEKQFLVTSSSIPKLPPLVSPSLRPALTERLSVDPLTKSSKVYFLHIPEDGSTVMGDEEEEVISPSRASSSMTGSIKKKKRKNKKESDGTTTVDSMKSEEEEEKGDEDEEVDEEDAEDNEEEENEEEIEEEGQKAKKNEKEEEDCSKPSLSKQSHSSSSAARRKSQDQEEQGVKSERSKSPLRSVGRKDSSRRISDLTVSFSVNEEPLDDSGPPPGSRSRARANSSAASSRKNSSLSQISERSSPTVSSRSSSITGTNKASNSSNKGSNSNNNERTTNRKKYQKTLSKIKLSTSFVREWYKVQGEY